MKIKSLAVIELDAEIAADAAAGTLYSRYDGYAVGRP